jgi:hypothetical protein
MWTWKEQDGSEVVQALEEQSNDSDGAKPAPQIGLAMSSPKLPMPIHAHLRQSRSRPLHHSHLQALKLYQP